MVAFTVGNVPAFMGALLSRDTFDAYGVHEITIKKGFNLIIEENEKVSYGTVRPLCFDAVKGKTLPEFMRFTLTAPEGTLQTLSAETGEAYDADNVLGLALNITYRSGVLSVTSGSSVKDIFAGKAVDTAWGEAVKKLFSAYGISE